MRVEEKTSDIVNTSIVGTEVLLHAFDVRTTLDTTGHHTLFLSLCMQLSLAL